MTTRIMALIAAMVMVFTISYMVLVPKAECLYCPSYNCYGQGTCGTGCFCFTVQNEPHGRCVSIE